MEFDNEELVALARLDIEKGDIESALAKLKLVLGGKKPPLVAKAMAARIYAQLGIYDRATRYFEDFLKQEPEAVVEQFQLGMAYLDSGEEASALKVWDKLLEKAPTHPPALFHKAVVNFRAKNTEEARQSLDALLKNAPADNLYFSRAKELLNAIDSDASVRGREIPAEPTSSEKGIMSRNAYNTEH